MGKATAYCAAHYPIKIKLTLSALGAPFLDHILTCASVFENTCLHLILSYCMSATEVETLNKTSKTFTPFHHMLLHAEPNIVCKLFQHDPYCASQTTMPIERRLKFLFLTLMRRLHAPSIVHSLTSNHTDSFRDPEKILREFKDALPTELLA